MGTHAHLSNTAIIHEISTHVEIDHPNCFGRTNMYVYIHISTYISTPISYQEIKFDQTSLSCILCLDVLWLQNTNQHHVCRSQALLFLTRGVQHLKSVSRPPPRMETRAGLFLASLPSFHQNYPGTFDSMIIRDFFS